jgi:hypothetical protein
VYLFGGRLLSADGAEEDLFIGLFFVLDSMMQLDGATFHHRKTLTAHRLVTAPVASIFGVFC